MFISEKGGELPARGALWTYQAGRPRPALTVIWNSCLLPRPRKYTWTQCRLTTTKPPREENSSPNHMVYLTPMLWHPCLWPHWCQGTCIHLLSGAPEVTHRLDQEIPMPRSIMGSPPPLKEAACSGLPSWWALCLRVPPTCFFLGQ